MGNKLRGGGGGAGGKTDSLKRRDKQEDSITIYFRYLDSSRNYKFDSSISDFTKRFPIPATNLYLGNDGTASKSYLFSPSMKAGWDPGFHAFDIYKINPGKVRFFNTTRPYSELNYLVGGRSEQMIEVFHTQNILPTWNVSLNYKSINSPGFFKNQKTSHSDYLIGSWYQSKKKRYNNYVTILSNNMQSSESGGFKTDKNYLKDPDYDDRFSIPTRIGGDGEYSTNFFNTTITTGNRYHELTMMVRQQYDLGKKDSLVTDSTVIPLFYPRLRFEHTFNYNKYSYEFLDSAPDSAYYYDSYGGITPSKYGSKLSIKDKWNELLNDFSVYQFPDAKNLQQFIKLGATIQNLKGRFDTGMVTRSLYNLIAHAEYRNRTRNRKWEIEANGKLYLNGFNSGDYEAHISLQRLIGKKLGYLQVGFENVNRSPSFLYNTSSTFYFDAIKSFNKENTAHFFASYYNPALKLKLTGDYYLVSNYMYITDYYKLQQEGTLFNFLLVSLQKTIKISKHWFWYTDIYLQQKAGDVDLNVPAFFTRNRLALEGIYFKNLDISTGVEVRYHTPYKADGYSPVLGQFTYQDSVTISNRPDVRLYMNFRIKSFKLYISASNLNAVNFSNGFNFTNNNIPSPGYAYPGLQLRFGIYWSFVN